MKPVKGTRVESPGGGTFIYPTAIPEEAWPEDAVMGQEWFAVPREQLPHFVSEYLNMLATAKTIDWCACRWEVHPDDVDLNPDADECKRCGGSADEHPREYEGSYRRPGSMEETVTLLTCKQFRQRTRRLRRADEDPLCPMHTEAGRILGFFQYLFPPEESEEAEASDSVQAGQ